jgi:hypothetical protein
MGAIFHFSDSNGVSKQELKTMIDNIKLLSDRVDNMEKTIETYGRLIDRLETKLDRHERSYAHGVE